MTSALDDPLLRARDALARQDLPAAYDNARAALLADAGDAEAHALLGIALSQLNDLASGEWHLRRALELAPPRSEWLVNLAVNLTRQGCTPEADECFAHADASSPGRLDVLAQWSRVVEMQDDLERAAALLERAESVGDVSLLRATFLARMGRYEDALAIMGSTREPSGAAQLERGRIQDRLGRYDDALRDWTEGKVKLLPQPAARYRKDVVDDFVARLKRFFVRANDEWLPRASPRTDLPQPVFIMGFPRSGTTLIESVLAKHSAVRAGGELTFVGEWPQLATRLIADAAPFPENLQRMRTADHHHVATLLRDHYFARATQRGLTEPGTRFFTDKMPFNEMLLPLVRMAFPHAKIVRVLRHPLDVCVSMLSHELGHGFNCAYGIDTIVHHLAAMCDLGRHYRTEFRYTEHTVRYEDFVRRPEEEAQRLCEYLELEWEADCLSAGRTGRHPATPSYADVAGPISDRSIGRYRNYSEALAPFAPRLAAHIAELGYDLALHPR